MKLTCTTLSTCSQACCTCKNHIVIAQNCTILIIGVSNCSKPYQLYKPSKHRSQSKKLHKQEEDNLRNASKLNKTQKEGEDVNKPAFFPLYLSFVGLLGVGISRTCMPRNLHIYCLLTTKDMEGEKENK